MAEKATKAVPVMAVAGVLVAAPHATTAAMPWSFTMSRPAAIRSGQATRLSSIAQRFYGHTADWRLLYQANRSMVHDPGHDLPG